MKLRSMLAAAGLMTLPMLAVAGGNHAHWTYTGKTGAAHWGDLDAGFAECSTGKAQSPIDIRAAKKADALRPIGFDYAAGPAEVVNNGHTIQVNLPAAGSVNLGGDVYQLLQFHFHTPSEEKVNGKAYPLVAHLVHKDAAGRLAVVGVLFRQGRENAALKAVFDGLPAREGEKLALAQPLNATDLLPADRAYWAFEGSLTTPPCSEGVRWQVLRQPVEVSAAQLRAFRKLYSMNARPVQPLNGRVVQQSL